MRLMNARFSRSLIRLFLCRVAAACLVGLLSLAARADGPVAGCSEDDLLNALFGGGDVTFEEDCSITITAPITIDSDTTIDAQGHNVTISGGGQVLVFEIEPGVNFSLIGLTITGGVNTNGGALYINDSATVLLTNC